MEFNEFAIKNISRNSRVYLAYFLSSLISSMLIFSFTMLIMHPDLDISFYKDFLKKGFNVSIVIAYVFVTFFIFYSVSVFLKGRYKEFGTLYMLGISKKHVFKLITYENMIVTGISGLLGTLLGLIFMKVFLRIISLILGIEALKFYFPYKAIIITSLMFVLMGFIISVFTFSVVKENKIATLLKEDKKPKKEPKTNVVIAFASLLVLIVSYYMAMTVTRDNITQRIVPVTITTIIVTYFIFSHVGTYLLKFIKSRQSLYRKSINMVCISNLHYKILDNTRMFFIISIISTFTFTSLSAVCGYWINKEKEIDRTYPESFFYQGLDENSEVVDSIKDELKSNNIKYYEIKGEFAALSPTDDSRLVNIISQSTYNKLAKSLNINSSINVNDDEAKLLTPVPGVNREYLNIGNLSLKVTGKLERRVLPAFFDDMYVVSDESYSVFYRNYNKFDAINVNDYKDTLDVCKKIEQKYSSWDDNMEYTLLLKAQILESTKIGYGMIMFLCIFLGLIFFVTTGSFLYNRCYMDINDDKIKYAKLSKIGLTFKEIKKISFIEIGVLFLIPYVVAAIHSFFALNSLKVAFDIDVRSIALAVIFGFFVIQILYFVIVRSNYLSNIKESK